MAEGRLKDEWARMSALLAMTANCHRDPRRRRPYTPSDFDPFAKRPQPLRVTAKTLRDIFMGTETPTTEAMT